MTLDKYFSTMKTLTDKKPATINGEKELYGYKLPKEWKIVTLGEIFRVINTNTRKIRIEPDKEYKLIVTRLYAKGVELKEIKKGSQIKAKYMYVVKEGDFIFSKINIKKGALGFIPPELDGAVVTTEHPILRLDEKKANKKFVFYYLSQPFIWNEFKRRSKGFADKSRTKINEFLEVKIALPPLEEQHKIVYVLDTIKHAIEVQDRLLDTLNELKRALMNRLFTKGLDLNQPTKQTEIGEIPAHWKVLSLGDILVKIQYGLSMKGHKDSNGYPMLRMNNIVDGRIILNDLQYVKIDYKTLIKFKLEKGDLLFNRTNSPDLVGKTAIFDIDGTYVFASYLIRLRVNSRMANPYFINYYLNWDKTQIRIKKLASRGVSQANVSATKLKTLKIALPPLDEQEQIVNILRTIDERISIIKKKRSALQELFDVMLHKLMTGQIRVTNLDEIYSSKRPSGV